MRLDALGNAEMLGVLDVADLQIVADLQMKSIVLVALGGVSCPLTSRI
ncbi:MAG: hypothetical protein ACI87E_001508 [Mariniblastus sp.]|jgi:hypothetical protein